ncbi:hypothetical protein [Levilactobacillus suantsaiihabitans]|uniref:Uncharacterized protein n=1 Tax=Levilactobacillus suantsaiihabitans TaxID=2487722 RepID=A0A4Z0JD36_9LACO|nr:hypothetical protein [Levilactobacillus suantsaiihabitans]TGD19724.1 hypothetical protein EGT51_02505 [Levilactobacillus suantsaiihabitans]
MFSSVRKIITIIFALVSFGIIFNTSPVLADNTSSSQADSNTADNQVTISGIQMPYTTFVSKSGERQKHYWLPNSEDPVTVKNILDNKYDENLVNSYKDDPIYKDAAATIITILQTCVWTYWENPVTITPNETLLDAVQTMMSPNNYLDNIIYQVCLTRDFFRYQIGVPFSLIQPDYDKYLKSGPERDTVKSDLYWPLSSCHSK